MNTFKPQRRRLLNWDYSSAGVYFLTWCCRNKAPLLGQIRKDTDSDLDNDFSVFYTPLGLYCIEEIERLATTRKDIRILKFVVMPNHVHVLVSLLDDVDDAGSSANAALIPLFVSAVKKACTAKAKELGMPTPIWQRSFHDHIVRNQADFDRIWEYIDNNPVKWMLDRFYVEKCVGAKPPFGEKC